MRKKILVIEDEEDIREVLRYNLAREGYEISVAESGEQGLQLALSSGPNLVLLDLMLPGMSGLDVCRALQADNKARSIPIVMVTAKGEESDIVVGLEMGADDYVTKPFSIKILLARVRAALRRAESAEAPVEETLQIGELSIDPARHEVLLQNNKIDLTATEFRILHFLAANRGKVYTRHQIVLGVHGDDYPVTDRSIDVQVTGLRKKLENYSDLLETVRGVGYRLKSE